MKGTTSNTCLTVDLFNNNQQIAAILRLVQRIVDMSSKLVDPYNDLLSEVEKLILRSVDEHSTAREKFHERMGELQCPATASITTLQEKMVQAVNFFKNVRLEGKSTIVSVPPPVT